MAPKPVKVKIPNLTTDFQRAIKILTKAKPKVSAAAQKQINLEIKKLNSLEEQVNSLCKSKMTHAFDPADGGDPE